MPVAHAVPPGDAAPSLPTCAAGLSVATAGCLRLVLVTSGCGVAPRYGVVPAFWLTAMPNLDAAGVAPTVRNTWSVAVCRAWDGSADAVTLISAGPAAIASTTPLYVAVWPSVKDRVRSAT